MPPKKKSSNSQLIDDVLNLNEKPLLKKPSRSEPTSNISEFNLVKSLTGKQGEVSISDLTKVLKKRKKHVEIRKKIQSARSKGRTLPKPLKKPKEQRVRRTAAFENVKKQLNRWDAVVTSNRASNHMKYPLPLDLENVKLSSNFRLKSDLQKKFEAAKPKTIKMNVKESKYPLTVHELIERHREIAKMRAIQSYKEAKAHRKRKIKSKQYHRIQRRGKIKNKIKDFEELQETNPGNALKMLEEIERARIEERASLRHRSTGKWAKSKQIRAKYDKENRQVLAQQLAISRELTQKIKKAEDSESEDELRVPVNTPVRSELNTTNPWTNPIKTSEEVQDLVNSYKKFWYDQQQVKFDDPGPTIVEVEKSEQTVLQKTDSKSKNKIKKQIKRNSIDKELLATTTDWEVSILNEDNIEKSIDNILDKFVHVEKQLKEKHQILRNNLKRVDKKKANSKSNSSKKAKRVDLHLSTQTRYPVIDEPLSETISTNAENKICTAKTTLASSSKSVNINLPTVATKAVNLNTEIPDSLMLNDNEENADQKVIISEAFQDDDIVTDFQKEKADDVNAEKPADINLGLPGWGTWAGTGIKLSKRKNRPFLIKFPKAFKRRDENRGNLIINEKSNEKVKTHLVSEVPFPFKTVKDFEASIRAPVGRTFIPETAFQKMIKPAVQTKMGVIIEPMTDEMLLKKKK